MLLTPEWSDSGTLVIVGFTEEGITIASDGFSPHDDGSPWVGAQKIMPVGKFGALAFVGELKVQARQSGKVIDQVDALEIARVWLAQHPDIDVKSARDSLSELIAAAFTEFFSKYDPGPAPKKERLRLIVTGYFQERSIIFRTRFYQPAALGEPMKVQHLENEPKPGELFSFGKYLVCDEILGGSSPALSEYKSEPVIQFFRELVRRNERHELRLSDYLLISDVCLLATESEEGKEFDPDPAEVGRPHWFATVTADQGFKWQKALPAFQPPK